MHKTINSTKDRLVTEVVKIKSDKKYRYSSGLFLVEGVKMVRDAIKSGSAIKNVFVEKSKQVLAQEFSAFPFDTYLVDDFVLEKMSATKTPQGVIATVEFKVLPIAPPSGNAVILDGIQDAGNAGTICRSALAAGVSDIYFVNSVDPYNPKTVKSSMSAVFFQNLFVSSDINEVLPHLKSVEIVCADMSGDNVFCSQRPQKFALVIGNEGSGVSDEFLKCASRVVSVPMDSRVESLNAGVSASIILFELTKKLS